MAYGSVLSDTEDTSAERKVRGAFFTPPELADFIARASIVNRDDRVLEPACGEAEFLISASKRLTSLGVSVEDINENVVGNEIHPGSAAAARRRMRSAGFDLQITTSDFFDLVPSEEKFSAVVGNPPYIRYQEFVGRQRTKARESSLAMGVQLDALSSSWAPFVVHSARFLDRGGRLGFVLPAELLSANYAAPIRRFLLESFANVEVILFESPVFPEVQEEVVLLLAAGFQQGRSASILMTQVASCGELGKERGFAAKVSGGVRWPIGKAAYDAASLLQEHEVNGLVCLSRYGHIRLGAVTGANGFFTLSAKEACDFGLGKEDVVAICPPGSRHLRSLSLSEETLAHLESEGKKTFVFSPSSEPSEAALRYIERGKQAGVDQAYKCRVRKPWWRIPGLKTCDLFFTYMNGAGPNLCENEANVCFLNSVHGLYLNDDVCPDARKLLPIAALCSATLLSAELVGRSYGGGILKLEPREAARMLVPSQQVLLAQRERLLGLREQVEDLLAQRNRDEATLRVDDILLPSMGFSRDDAHRMHGLLLELRARRGRRGKGVRFSTEESHGK